MPHTFVNLGASGDLIHRKLVPALYRMFRKGRLPKETRIVGFSRTAFTHDAWRSDLAKAVARYVGGDFDSGLWDKFSASARPTRQAC
jgi:glucose-6-phosphate 1-dehydrogenase